MLIWQDLPLQWGYGQVRRQAVRQARQAVVLLGHHPSVALWCGHNEPLALDVDPRHGRRPRGRSPAWSPARCCPSWNKTGLDRSIRRALERADGSRAVVAHSGHPAPPGLGHRQPPVLRVVPRRRAGPARPARPLPGAGPLRERVRRPGRARDGRVHGPGALAGPRLGRTWRPTTPCSGPSSRSGSRPAGRRPSTAWRAATQDYQATLLRHHIETLRRLKYRPTGGFCLFLLADAQPAVSWSILDHERRPKAGYQRRGRRPAPR